jgi:hypothetical protein
MALFQNFKKSTQAPTPQFMNAEIADAKFSSEAKARANALRSQNMLGAGLLYNQGMGDKSPIADAIFGGESAAGASAPSYGPATPDTLGSLSNTLPVDTGIAGMEPFMATDALAGPAGNLFGTTGAGGSALTGSSAGAAGIPGMGAGTGALTEGVSLANTMAPDALMAGMEGTGLLTSTAGGAPATAGTLGTMSTAAPGTTGALSSAAGGLGGSGAMSALGTAMPWLGAAMALYSLLG